jgi:NAD-dependent DNA ligase
MIKFLDHVSKRYYEGNPLISDAEFDVLSAHYNYLSVGHSVTDGVKHYEQMFSLQKVFNIEETPFSLNGAVSSPKRDGAAVSLLYVDGKLTLGLTRGDGITGRDVTDKLALLVPNKISLKGIRQVTGEVVAPKEIPNSRNYASGALNLKSLEEFKQRDVTFVAYDCIPSKCPTYTETMSALHMMEGFKAVTWFDCSIFPQDGIVYRIDDNQAYKDLGFTSRHPRGAFALKEQKEGVETKLLDVVWQVGKSGVVSPVAILEPVLIGDAMVAKATLHNIEYINSLELEIGCTVEVIRSGEIIPRILRRTDVSKNIS